MTTLRAKWIAPMDSPVLENGQVSFENGKIVSFGRASGAAGAIDLGESVICPGLLNSHVHLELSNLRCDDTPPTPFTDWILSIGPRMGRGEPDFEQRVRGAVEEGVRQCLKFGVTTVGDISQQLHVTRPALCAGPIRSVIYGEVIGLGKMRERAQQLIAAAVEQPDGGAFCARGISPHAPYTVDFREFQQCARLARQMNMPICTHLAETTHEEDFLRDHSGPFGELWRKLGMWEDGVTKFNGSPIQFAAATGVLAQKPLLAHVNYVTDADLDELAKYGASAVYCPRTHAFFGHPPHRWRDMLARGINVAIGTDSCASSPDLNLLDDLRLVRRAAPSVPASTLWELVSTRAARALRMEHSVGSIAAGKCADFTVFRAPRDPLEHILGEQVLPSQVWINGGRVQIS